MFAFLCSGIIVCHHSQMISVSTGQSLSFSGGAHRVVGCVEKVISGWEQDRFEDLNSQRGVENPSFSSTEHRNTERVFAIQRGVFSDFHDN